MTEKELKNEIERILRQVRDTAITLERFSVKGYPPDNPYLFQLMTLIKANTYLKGEREVPRYYPAWHSDEYIQGTSRAQQDMLTPVDGVRFAPVGEWADD